MNQFESWIIKLESRLQLLLEGTNTHTPCDEDSGCGGQLAYDMPDNTAPVKVVSDANIRQLLPPAAFLVVDGVQLFPLDRMIISVGRAPENDLVIRDLRVSRQHAQLRVVGGRFVVFDLASTGGTSINGAPILQQPLSPGDVISLAGVPLVYGEESPSNTGHTLKVVL